MAMLQQVFPTYSIYWIAAYPVDNTIHPLNNWGLVIQAGSWMRGLPPHTIINIETE